MKKEYSAGGIVFRTDRSQGSGDNQVLNNNKQVLIRQSNGANYWNFPKGHIEEGETSKQAAIREVQEETGVKAEIIDEAGVTEYIFDWEGKKILKNVKYYLMKYVSGETDNYDYESSAVEWVTPDEALKKLSFDDDKKLLQKALVIYNRHSEEH